MKSKEILETLSLLDPEDKDHWTADGQPRLDAIGEGVTRAQVQAAAPQFNRANATLPEPPPPELSFEEKAIIVKTKKAEANAAVVVAQAAVNEANKVLKAAQHEVDKLDVELRDVDKRTDTEINQAFLQADFDHRLKKAAQREQATALLAQAGVSGRDISMYKLGPADRAIAEANIRARKERLKG